MLGTCCLSGMEWMESKLCPVAGRTTTQMWSQSFWSESYRSATTKSWRSTWTRTAYTAHCHRCAAPGHHAGPPGSTWMLPLRDLGPNAATTDPQSHRSHGQNPTCWLAGMAPNGSENPGRSTLDFTTRILPMCKWISSHCTFWTSWWSGMVWTPEFDPSGDTTSTCSVCYPSSLRTSSTGPPAIDSPCQPDAERIQLRPLGIGLCSGVIKSALDFAGLTLMDFHHHAAKKHTDWQRQFRMRWGWTFTHRIQNHGLPRLTPTRAELWRWRISFSSWTLDLWFHPLP